MYQQPNPYQPSYGAYPTQPQNSGMAITGMVLGIVTAVIALLGCMPFIGGGALLTGVPAVACSWYSLSQIRNSMGAMGGKGMAIAGICTGLAGSVFGVATLIFWSYIVTLDSTGT